MLFIKDLPIRIEENRILLNIKITPKASTNKIGKVFNNSLKIYVTAAPEDGQANKAVIKLLAEALEIRKNSIFIMQGLTAQNKVISITGNKDNLIKHLQIIIN